MIRLFVGFDEKEALAYHVFSQSVIEHASVPVSFVPIHKGLIKGFDGKRDGTNAFTYSRYLVPMLCGFSGWAIFADGDMVCDTDIKALWELQHDNQIDKALCVVKHEYDTKNPVKYVGTSMQSDNASYPRKNWSSVILWNCGHFANRALTSEFVAAQSPQFLHRFEWLRDEQIGSLPTDWNYLVREYPPASPNLYHYTCGVPGIKFYADDAGSWKWHRALSNALKCAGEDSTKLVERSIGRVGTS